MIKRYFYPFLCALTTAYTLLYMRYGVPYKNSGALSKIGLTHRLEFVIWGVLTFVTLAVGITLAYRKHTNTKLYIPFLAVSGVGMALTLIFDFDYNVKPDYYFHCAGSLAFSVAVGVCIFLLFALTYRKAAVFCAFAWCTGIILIADLICLIIFKETGLIEALPIFAGYIMLSTVILRSDKVEIKQ